MKAVIEQRLTDNLAHVENLIKIDGCDEHQGEKRGVQY